MPPLDRMFIFEPPPLRNESICGVDVYSHSGEFAPRVVDFVIPGRGISFQMSRAYRAACVDHVGLFGRGWHWTYDQRIEEADGGLHFHDGLARLHSFFTKPGASSLEPPPGLYCELVRGRSGTTLHLRRGISLRFAVPSAGGRLVAITDRNRNELLFAYSANAITVTDPLGRTVIVALTDGRATHVTDPAGRIWLYQYDERGCLCAVVRPSTGAAAPSTRYGYDDACRLVDITNALGEGVLKNEYDDRSRVVRQRHGTGVIRIEYEESAFTRPTHSICTRIQLKNGARVSLEHDTAGRVITHTLLLRADSLSEDISTPHTTQYIPIVTRSRYNLGGELVYRQFPAGDVTRWTYDDKNRDPRGRGNRLSVIRVPAERAGDTSRQLKWTYRYELTNQLCVSETDPLRRAIRYHYDDRGNMIRRIMPKVSIGRAPRRLTHSQEFRYEYNRAGQLIRSTNPSGAITEYFYYPASAPSGERGEIVEKPRQRLQAAGYLAKLVRDAPGHSRSLQHTPASIETLYQYDPVGNLTSITDGKGLATSYYYDQLGRPIARQSRPPFNDIVHLSYDAEGMQIEQSRTFVRTEATPTDETPARIATTRRERTAYNTLGNVVSRTVLADGREITEEYFRDAAERIVRRVRPGGLVDEFCFDERDSLVESRLAAGTAEESRFRYFYGLNGELRAKVDARGHSTNFIYDGFTRCLGVRNADGTSRSRELDSVGQTVRITVMGADEPVRGNATTSGVVSDTRYRYDALGRCRRIDQYRVGRSTDRKTKTSSGDVLSTILGYGSTGLPVSVRAMTGQSIAFDYDGMDRLVWCQDSSGESVRIAYDRNSNLIAAERVGSSRRSGRRFQRVVTNDFDELDRLVARRVDGHVRERVTYNALGAVDSYTFASQSHTAVLRDAFGRRVGLTTATADTASADRPPASGRVTVVERRDDGGRVIERVNPALWRTNYRYDGLGRMASKTVQSGYVTSYGRDGNGNVVEIRDSGGLHVSQTFDPMNRLVARKAMSPDGGKPNRERYEYDALGRLVRAYSDGVELTRRFDSFSRLVQEAQAKRVVQYQQDVAGNSIEAQYPSGHTVTGQFDESGRLVSLSLAGQRLADFTYLCGDLVAEQRGMKSVIRRVQYEPLGSHATEVTTMRAKRVLARSLHFYDTMGNPVKDLYVEPARSKNQFTYDSLGRLVGALYEIRSGEHQERVNWSAVGYSLSPVGLWEELRIRADGTDTVATIPVRADSRGFYLDIGSRTFNYDLRGNCVEHRDVQAFRRYGYDQLGRLVRADITDRSTRKLTSVTYAYDVLGRQIEKQVRAGSVVTRYLRTWSRGRLIEESDSTNRTVTSFVYGPRNHAVAMVRRSRGQVDVFSYVLDGRNLVSALVREDGRVVERYAYDAFGQPLILTADGSPMADQSSAVGNPILIGGQLWDWDSGVLFENARAFNVFTGQRMNSGLSLTEPLLVPANMLQDNAFAAPRILESGGGTLALSNDLTGLEALAILGGILVIIGVLIETAPFLAALHVIGGYYVVIGLFVEVGTGIVKLSDELGKRGGGLGSGLGLPGGGWSDEPDGQLPGLPGVPGSGSHAGGIGGIRGVGGSPTGTGPGGRHQGGNSGSSGITTGGSGRSGSGSAGGGSDSGPRGSSGERPGGSANGWLPGGGTEKPSSGGGGGGDKQAGGGTGGKPENGGTPAGGDNNAGGNSNSGSKDPCSDGQYHQWEDPDGTVHFCVHPKGSEMPNPDAPDSDFGGTPFPPGLIRIIPGVASFDPEGGGDDGIQGDLPPGIRNPFGPAGMPNPETDGPLGPASLVGLLRTLLMPNPETDGPMGPASIAGGLERFR